MKQVDFSLVTKIRKKHPLVLIISNIVTLQNVANVVSLLGGSPLVIEAVQEADEIVKICDAICINLGTINPQQEKLIAAVLKANQKYHHPVVLDPVAVGSSNYREKVARDILDKYPITAIRANASEVAALIDVPWQGRGIDSGTGKENTTILARKCSQKYHALVLLSGEVDVVSDNQKEFTSSFTNPNFPKYVGTGDMLSATVATFLAANIDKFLAANTAIVYFTICGQKCTEQGLGTWFMHFTDSLGGINERQLSEYYERNND